MQHAGSSIVGRVRTYNEDAWGACPEAGVFVVADGCGGLSSGARAAQLAVESVGRAFTPGDTVREDAELPADADPLARATWRANEAVHAAAVGPDRGMGTAMAALRLAPPWAVTVSIGDCRVYRYRDGILRALTTDDDLWRVALLEGRTFEEVSELATKHGGVIAQALGTGGPIQLDVRYHQHRPADLYLLCTDGLWRGLHPGSTPIIGDTTASFEERVHGLLAAADARYGEDNATAVLVGA